MGQQHNTHIYNDTDEIVRIILTDTNQRKTELPIDSKGYVCIPTPKGINTITAFVKQNGSFNQYHDAQYTVYSDISVIVKRLEKNEFTIVRSVYGDIKKEHTGLQK